MPDSLGTLVDAHWTAAQKLWHVQDFVFEAKRLSFDEFSAKYSLLDAYTKLQQLGDLNLDRTRLMREIDECLADAVRTGQARVDARVKITG